MPDLKAALKLYDPKRLPKHLVMLASAGMAIEDGKLLLLRDPNGFWAAVGGFLETGETPEEAILREVREELGVDAEITRVLHPAIFWHVDGESTFLLFIYGIRLASNDVSPDPTEVTDVRWVTLQELLELEMLPWVRTIFERSAKDWLTDWASENHTQGY